MSSEALSLELTPTFESSLCFAIQTAVNFVKKPSESLNKEAIKIAALSWFEKNGLSASNLKSAISEIQNYLIANKSKNIFGIANLDINNESQLIDFLQKLAFANKIEKLKLFSIANRTSKQTSDLFIHFLGTLGGGSSDDGDGGDGGYTAEDMESEDSAVEDHKQRNADQANEIQEYLRNKRGY